MVSSDSESENQTLEGGKQTIKCCLLQNFCQEYMLKYPVTGTSVSTIGNGHVHCMLCNVDFSIEHSDLNDVKIL